MSRPGHVLKGKPVGFADNRKRVVKTVTTFFGLGAVKMKLSSRERGKLWEGGWTLSKVPPGCAVKTLQRHKATSSTEHLVLSKPQWFPQSPGPGAEEQNEPSTRQAAFSRSKPQTFTALTAPRGSRESHGQAGGGGCTEGVTWLTSALAQPLLGNWGTCPSPPLPRSPLSPPPPLPSLHCTPLLPPMPHHVSGRHSSLSES